MQAWWAKDNSLKNIRNVTVQKRYILYMYAYIYCIIIHCQIISQPDLIIPQYSSKRPVRKTKGPAIFISPCILCNSAWNVIGSAWVRLFVFFSLGLIWKSQAKLFEINCCLTRLWPKVSNAVVPQLARSFRHTVFIRHFARALEAICFLLWLSCICQ